MYSYIHDPNTGGLLLNSSPTKVSKEPRPVYAAELDLLGFGNYWKYDKQTNTPYMWAEANRYWYRGKLVASLLGGDVYHAPVIQLTYICSEWRENPPDGKPMEKVVCENPKDKGRKFIDKKGNVFTLYLPDNGDELRPIDIVAMVEKNREILGWLEDTTAKKILDIYQRYTDKLDIFHVAFSGGKDSCVLLDLVKSVLPHDSFVVVFGDTGMEFPDTYDVIDKVEKQCKEDGVKFYRASSHFTPAESWELFAPPSRVLRWCCSVHKSAPQTLKLREVTGKFNYKGLAYIGVRAEESEKRSEYEYENYGKKIKGQYFHNSILEWTSAEIWLYIYAHNILINDAYIRGCSRVGCVCCPMAGNIGEYKNLALYPEIFNQYAVRIRKTNSKTFTDSQFDDFMINGAWKNRADGKFVKGVIKKYFEETKNGTTMITIMNPSSNWREWIKTLNWDIPISVVPIDDGFVVSVSEQELKKNPSMAKILRQVFKKTVYCNACTVCMANCKNSCISFENNNVEINNCLHCLDCHNLPNGCLLYDSLKIPNGGIIMKKNRSVNTFQTHAPKQEWIADFFDNEDTFFIENNLAKPQQTKFNVFLEDSKLSEKKHFSSFAELIKKIKWDTELALGLILVNLVAHNPQFEWYVKNLEIRYVYTRKNIIDMLVPEIVKDVDQASHVFNAFKRIVETPFGTKLNFGYVSEDGDIVRTVCSISDSRVILYALYKFAEKCNDYKEFTLNALLSDNIERDGVSPTRIFGLNREAMIPLLLGLSSRYPYFINATFTNDLDKISLKDDKSSEDVLKLFEEDNDNG